MNNSEKEAILFEVKTPLGFVVRTTVGYWNIISTVKHPIMQNRLGDVMQTLILPDEIRVSKNDEKVFLFYRGDGNKRWVCAVSKKLEIDGFLITAYRTSAIKEGILVWQK
jgi:hypothetical protein